MSRPRERGEPRGRTYTGFCQTVCQDFMLERASTVHIAWRESLYNRFDMPHVGRTIFTRRNSSPTCQLVYRGSTLLMAPIKDEGPAGSPMKGCSYQAGISMYACRYRVPNVQLDVVLMLLPRGVRLLAVAERKRCPGASRGCGKVLATYISFYRVPGLTARETPRLRMAGKEVRYDARWLEVSPTNAALPAWWRNCQRDENTVLDMSHGLVRIF